MRLLTGVFFSVCSVTNIAFSSSFIPKERSGVASSTIMIGQNVGNAVAPIIGSFFVRSFGYKGMFCGFGGLLAAEGLLLLFIQYQVEKKRSR